VYEPSSSAQRARQVLGDRLREVRVRAGLSGRELGRLAGWHPSKVSKIEYARQAPSVDDIRAWCGNCGAGDQEADLIASLRTVEGMFVEWRRMERTGLRLAQESVVPLFERTTSFRAYDSWVIPGPFQTRAYTSAVLTGLALSRAIPDDVAEAVAVRMDRQRILYEGGHRFAVLLEESVLRHRLGGTEAMLGQLGHLINVTSLPSVSLGIVPMRAVRPRSPVEGFWVFDDVRVNVELVSGWLTITQPHEIALYVQAFAELSKVAVYGAAARGLITDAITALDREADL